MNVLKLLGLSSQKNASNNSSANIAKERLKILVAHNCINNTNISFIPAMQNEIIEVVKKYVNVDPDNVSINIESQTDYSILEVNVQLPSQ